MVDYRELCEEILDLDTSISFVGAASSDGNLLATITRKSSLFPLTVDEQQLAIMQSVIKINMEKTLESKLGKTVYSFVEYQTLKTASIALYEQDTLKQKAILFMSFYRTANAHLIIDEKIKPFLKTVSKSL